MILSTSSILPEKFSASHLISAQPINITRTSTRNIPSLPIHQRMTKPNQHIRTTRSPNAKPKHVKIGFNMPSTTAHSKSQTSSTKSFLKLVYFTEYPMTVPKTHPKNLVTSTNVLQTQLIKRLTNYFSRANSQHLNQHNHLKQRPLHFKLNPMTHPHPITPLINA